MYLMLALKRSLCYLLGLGAITPLIASIQESLSEVLVVSIRYALDGNDNRKDSNHCCIGMQSHGRAHPTK